MDAPFRFGTRKGEGNREGTGRGRSHKRNQPLGLSIGGTGGEEGNREGNRGRTREQTSRCPEQGETGEQVGDGGTRTREQEGVSIRGTRSQMINEL